MQSAPNISGGSQQNSISQTTEAHGAVKKQRQQPKKQNMKWLHTDPPTRSPEISNGCESLLLQSPNLHQCWDPGASRDSRCLESQFNFAFSLLLWLYFCVLKPRSTPVVLENAVKRIYFNFNRLSISMRVFWVNVSFKIRGNVTVTNCEVLWTKWVHKQSIFWAFQSETL